MTTCFCSGAALLQGRFCRQMLKDCSSLHAQTTGPSAAMALSRPAMDTSAASSMCLRLGLHAGRCRCSVSTCVLDSISPENATSFGHLHKTVSVNKAHLGKSHFMRSLPLRCTATHRIHRLSLNIHLGIIMRPVNDRASYRAFQLLDDCL